MCYPHILRSRMLMRHDGGNPLRYQDHRVGFRALPRKAMECANVRMGHSVDDGLRRFVTRMYPLTTPTHPGKINVTHTLEVMLSNKAGASTEVSNASQRGMSRGRAQIVANEIMNTPAILTA